MPPFRKNYYTRRNENLQRNGFTINDPVVILSDSEEEEKNINTELSDLYNELEKINNQLTRTRTRMRKLYERREQIRIKKAIRKREIEIRSEMSNKWIPSLEYVSKHAAEVQSNILDQISPLVQKSDKVRLTKMFDNISNGGGSKEKSKETSKTPQETLNDLCGPGFDINDLQLDLDELD